MLQKTKGIVFKSTRFGESSLICKIYTEKFGLQNCIVSGVRSAKSKNKASIYQALMILDLVIYHHDSKSLKRIKEAKPAVIYRSVPFNIIKSSIGLFLIEVLNKCVKEEEKNQALFEFIVQSFSWFDDQPEGFSNFHLVFLVQLANHLGFKLHGDFSVQNSFFDLQNGIFAAQRPSHAHFVEGKEAELFNQIISADYDQSTQLKISRRVRNEMMNHLIIFFQIHVEGFTNLKSPKILKEVLE